MQRLRADRLRAVFALPVFHTAEAANKAAGPYMAAAGRAQAIMGVYSDQAQQMVSTADQLQQAARTLSANANAYKAVGNTADAEDMIAKAKAAVEQATSLTAQAAQYQGVASKISASIPMYSVAGGAAAARAAALANPA